MGLTYEDGKHLLPENAFRINASGVSGFFNGTNQWYREKLVQPNEKGFTGNSASVLGTIVHHGLDCHVTGKYFDIDELDDYLAQQSTIVDELNVDHIINQYPIMLARAIAFVDSNYRDSDLISEEFVTEEIGENIYAGGSVDLQVVNNAGQVRIVDYKTTSAKKLPTTIAWSHLAQLLTYAYCKGTDVKEVAIIYISTESGGEISERTGKPLKTYPCEVVELVHHVTQEDRDMIKGILNVISDSVELFRDKPELRHILSQDARLVGCQCSLKKEEEI